MDGANSLLYSRPAAYQWKPDWYRESVDFFNWSIHSVLLQAGRQELMEVIQGVFLSTLNRLEEILNRTTPQSSPGGSYPPPPYHYTTTAHHSHPAETELKPPKLSALNGTHDLVPYLPYCEPHSETTPPPHPEPTPPPHPELTPPPHPEPTPPPHPEPTPPPYPEHTPPLYTASATPEQDPEGKETQEETALSETIVDKAKDSKNAEEALAVKLEPNILVEYVKRKHICLLCGKNLRTRRFLETHIRRKHPKWINKASDASSESETESAVDDSAKKTEPLIKETEAQSGSSYTCGLCGKNLKKLTYLRKHMDKVHSEEVHHCKICGKTFKHEFYVRLHVKQVHRPKITCSICNHKIREELFNGHMRRHREFPAIKCGRCSKTFWYPSLLRAHEKKCGQRAAAPTGKIGFYYCRICDQNVDYGLRYQHNAEFHGPDSEHKCLRCGKKVKSRATLVGHMKNVHSPKITCPICGQKHVEGTQFNWHMKRHAENPVIKCKECGKQFAELSLLKLHEKRMHDTSGTKIVCDVCGKSLLARDLKKHMEIVHPPEGACWPCPNCPKTFTCEPYLKNHMMTHNNGSFLCQLCGKEFRQKVSLARHVLTHKEPSFQCDQCDKKFHLKARLKDHLRTHSNDRRYQCPECPKAYFDKRSLDKHMGTHLIIP